MLEQTPRFFKRLVVLLPGIGIAYVSLRDIFPYFKRRLPLALAIFITYVIGAYVLVPAIIRLLRLLRPVKHLPHYCVTPDGFASDPINIGIIASHNQLTEAMQASGWSIADPHRPKYMLRYLLSVMFRHGYPSAPVSSLYLFGRKQDVAFEIPLEEGLGRRHHVRFWATTYNSEREPSLENIYSRSYKPKTANRVYLWIGAASLDTGVAFIRHNFQLTHQVAPDTDSERELIIKQLKTSHQLSKPEMIRLSKPYRLVNRVWRGHLKSDGKLKIVSLV